MTIATSHVSNRTALPWLRVASGLLPFWVSLTLVVLMTACRSAGTVDSDVAWQLWVAGRIHAGAHLYRDIIEVNPPLWFWMALPIDRIASLLNLRIETVLICSTGLLVALSLAATDQLLDHLPRSARTTLLAYAALALAGIPWVHVGQREQLVLIGALPYTALIAARRDGRTVSPLLAVLVGSGAAVGFALKHYFLIVPGLFELWLLSSAGRPWRLWRPEIVSMVIVGAVYATSILLFAPDFLTRIVPLVRLAYGDLRPRGLGHLFGPYAILSTALLAVVAVHTRKITSGEGTLTKAFAIAGAGFAIVYFVQAKGWIYHAIPMVGFGSLALLALLVETNRAGRRLILAAPALVALPLLFAVNDQLHPALPDPDLNSAIDGLGPNQNVGFLAVETAVPWSVTLQHQFRYPSRYMGYWMLGAVVKNERLGSPDSRLTALGRQTISDTVDDFSCLPPARIVVSRPLQGQPGFDILTFFLRDPRFSALLSHYRVRSRTTFESFERVTPLLPPTSPCRPGI